MTDRMIIDLNQAGQMGSSLPELDVPAKALDSMIPGELLRKEDPHLPEVAEPQVVRHYTNLSARNYHVDRGMYPLGSCTMKYNPKINDWTASQPMITDSHPHQPGEVSQGKLRIYHELEEMLCRITGMSRCTLQPAAGSQGELTGVLVMRKYHEDRGNQKKTILIPDAAHGTNPASVAMAGYQVVEVASNERGMVDMADFRAHINEDVAGFMLTNPNTLGLFEENLPEIARLIHSVDGLMYMDGANMNALLGIVRPADLGFDITHLNLHKTFSTPHGGGGPGSGPIGVVEKLVDFLPVPRIEKVGDQYQIVRAAPKSIGQLHAFFGNYGVIVRAWTYIRMLGAQGLADVSRGAIINANYLRVKLSKVFQPAFDRACMHEFVLSAESQKKQGVKALDIAKRLLDYGFHAPTMYFPLIVHEALMIEPTESEHRDTLDRFIETLQRIAAEIREDPELVINAPYNTPVRRVDETQANRQLNVHWV